MSTEEAEPLVTADVAEAESAAASRATPQPEPYTAPPGPTPAAASGQRPELLLGGAFVSGVVLAKLLGRRHGG